MPDRDLQARYPTFSFHSMGQPQAKIGQWPAEMGWSSMAWVGDGGSVGRGGVDPWWEVWKRVSWRGRRTPGYANQETRIETWAWKGEMMDVGERRHWERLDDQTWMWEGSKLEKKLGGSGQGEVYLGMTRTIVQSMIENLQ